MRSDLVAALILAFVVAAGLVTAQPSRLADRILAVVDGRPLSLSEVRLVERLRGLSREDALEEAIDERLMFEQAARLPQTAPSAEESQRAYAALAEQLGETGPTDEAGLRELARRQATILKYVDFRFRPLVRAERATRPGFDAGEAAEEGTADLDARLEAWIAELRDEASIRYNPAEPGGP